MTQKEEIERIKLLLTLIKENATEIRRNLKYVPDNELKDAKNELDRIFNEIDVYRQHTEYLKYKAEHPEEFQE